MRDWQHGFERTVKRLESDLLTARFAGATRYRFGNRGQIVNPQKLTLSECAAACRAHAETIVNRAILQAK